MEQTHSKLNRPTLSQRFYENRFVWISFAASALVMLLVYICFELIPFGSRTILRMDLYHQYGPLFAELYERLVGGESLIYSWDTGLGSSFLGNFYNYLSSPLSVIILLFGHSNIPEAIATMILLKAALASAAFAYYLKRSTGKNDATISAFGVLYSFCGFFIAYYWNVMWLDAMLLLPLIALGIEQIIKKGRFWLYTAALALTMLSNYYMAFMVCIFAVLYFLVYYFSHYEITARFSGLQPEGEKRSLWSRMKNSRFLQSGFRFAGGSILSGGIAAFALIPTYFILQACSATSGTFPEKYASYFTIFDFLANHFASVTPTIRSSGEDVMPNVYCGAIVLILIPLYLFAKSISKREKVMHLSLLVFFYFSFNTNFLNYIWHGFHFPNDLPYRQSFLYSFILLIMAYQVLMRLKEYSTKETAGVGLAVMAYVVIVQKITSKNVDELSVILTLILIAIYVLVMVLMKDKRYQSSAVAVLLLCCVVTEAAAANTDNYSMDQPKSNYVSDLPDFQAVKKQLDERENGGFYRMELTNLRARMDPAWYHYNGVSTFSSMAYEKVSNLQSRLGMFGNFINSYTYHLQTPIYNSMFGLKYIVNNTVEVDPDAALYTKLPIAQGKFTAYENNYALPIAFRVNDTVQSWATDGSDPFLVQQEFFQKATGCGTLFHPMKISSIDYYNIDSFSDESQLGTFTFFRTTPGEDASLTVHLISPGTENLYLYVKSDNVEQISISSDSYNNTQNVDREYILDIGRHQKGEIISVDITINSGDSGYIDFYAYGFDETEFKRGYDQLKADSLQVERFTDTEISGTVNAAENGVLYTSIPYDEGWTVTVDGEKVAKQDLLAVGDALLAIPIGSGSHTVSFSYTPRGMYIGIGISVFALAVLILLLVWNRSGKRPFFLEPYPIRKADPDTEPQPMKADGNWAPEDTTPPQPLPENPDDLEQAPEEPLKQEE